MKRSGRRRAGNFQVTLDKIKAYRTRTYTQGSSQKYNKIKQKVVLIPRGHAVLEKTITKKACIYVRNSLFTYKR